MTQTPPEWVQIRAAKLCGWYPEQWGDMCDVYKHDDCFRALCDMIERYEQPPVDRKLLCVMEAWRPLKNGLNHSATLDAFGIRCIELWEEGFGK